MKDNVALSKKDKLESFISSSVSQEVEILPLEPSNTKGNGKHIKGGKEKAN